jgi:hypothetical protein
MTPETEIAKGFYTAWTHTRRWRFSGPVTDVLCKLPFAEFFEKNRIRCKRSLPDFY